MTVADGIEQSKPKAKQLLLELLQEQPRSIDELIHHLLNNRIPFARRMAKELAWQMAEDGECRWNDRWLLELVVE